MKRFLCLVCAIATVFACPSVMAETFCQGEETTGSSSRPSHEKMNLTINNKSGHKLRLYYLGSDSNRHPFGSIEPGLSKTEHTSPQRVWVITDDHDNCIKLLETDVQDMNIDIE